MENPPIWNTKTIQTYIWLNIRNNDLIHASSITESVLKPRQNFEEKL